MKREVFTYITPTQKTVLHRGVCNRFEREWLWNRRHKRWKSFSTRADIDVASILAESYSLGEDYECRSKECERLTKAPKSIADKYHKGKVKSTLKRELNVPAIAVTQAFCSPQVTRNYLNSPSLIRLKKEMFELFEFLFPVSVWCTRTPSENFSER